MPIRSLALSLCFVPLSVVALADLPASERGSGAGLFNATRELGGSIGTAWMSTHHLVKSQALLQANTYFVMSLIDEAVRANAGDFTPEHLIERIEYTVGSVVTHPMLASLSLGMGQRFATKGGYILAPRSDGSGSVSALTDLLIP